MRIAQREILLAALTVAVCSGCGGSDGPPRAAVSGIVSYNGEAIDEGTIRFIPTEGTTGPATGGSIKGGVFDISADMGPVVGKNLVAITGQKFTGRTIDAMPPMKIMWEERLPMVPRKLDQEPEYVVEVESHGNEYTLELTGPKVTKKKGKSSVPPPISEDLASKATRKSNG